MFAMGRTEVLPFVEGSASQTRGSRRRRRLASLVHHAGVAARVNLFVVGPLTLLLLLLTEVTPAQVPRLLLTVAVLTNSSFLVINTYYHVVWEPRRSSRRWTDRLILLAALPCLGGLAALGGALLLELTDQSLLPKRPSGIVMVSALISTVYGMAFFATEDSRRSRREALLQAAYADRMQEEAERAREQAEVTALQALVNPHFVFNGLNSIAALIHEDPDRAEETTLRLARLMRHILEMKDVNLVPLEKEANITRAYLDIEKLRMGDRLHYEIALPPTLLAIPVPPMVLQPLVENAVRHGAWQRPQGGCVWVEARARGGRCEIVVSDNGPGYSREKGTGTGMRVVRERLARMYGDAAEMKFERDLEEGRTIVTLTVPISVAKA